MNRKIVLCFCFFFFQAEDGIRDIGVTGVQTCALPILPALERASGRQAGVGFGVAYYPGFLRESTAIADYYDPGAIIFGRHDQATIDRLLDLHKIFKVEPKVVSIRTAEAVKYTNNAWHALKISFANEIGNIG